MPGTFTGLMLFLACLAPGFVYAGVRELHLPERVSSPFRETARVVLAGIACDAVALLLFAAVRSLFPSVTPDIGRWLREGSRYAAAHYSALVIWGTLVLALATGMAALSARYLPRVKGPLYAESSWWLLFRAYPVQVSAAAIHVECELTDGSYLSGTLQHFAHTADEIPGRELALVAPLRYRRGPGEPTKPLPDRAFASVRADQIKFFTVTYLDRVP